MKEKILGNLVSTAGKAAINSISKDIQKAYDAIDGESNKLTTAVQRAETEFDEKATPMLDETGIAEMQNHSVYFDKPEVHLEDVVLDNGRLGPTGATGMTGSASTGSAFSAEEKKALMNNHELDISNLKTTTEGLQEYWIQWQNQAIQSMCK